MGTKSDPGDAKLLADVVRTERHNHRPIAGDSDLADGVNLWLGRSTNAPAVLAIARTPELGRELSRSKIASEVRKDGRQRSSERRAEEIASQHQVHEQKGFPPLQAVVITTL